MKMTVKRLAILDILWSLLGFPFLLLGKNGVFFFLAWIVGGFLETCYLMRKVNLKNVEEKAFKQN